MQQEPCSTTLAARRSDHRFALAPVALAICLALSVGAPQVGHAQTSAAPVAISIAAQPLSQALTELARQTGTALVAVAALLENKTAPAVAGQFAPQEAVNRLLAGSGLTGSFSQGVLTVRAAAPAGAEATLPLVMVTAGAERSGTTEGTASYTTSSMSTATKLPLSIRETPQSVTVITRQRLEDQGLVTVSNVMRNTPGMTVTGPGPNREVFYARGFRVENLTIDGLAVTNQYTRQNALLNDMAIYDRVEVVRGSTGFTQGAGTPSAAINLVRKRPTRDFQGHIQGQVGRWNHYNAELDVSGPINESGSLRGRAVLSYTDADSFMDVVDGKRQIVYAIGEADIAPNTLLTLGASYQKNDTNNTYGGIGTAVDGSDLRLPRSTYYGTAWNFYNDDNLTVFASLEHRFDNDWRIKLAGNRISNDNELTMAGVSYNSGTGKFDYSSGLQDSRYERASYDLTASGPFSLLGRSHDAVLGAEMRTADARNQTAGYWPSPFYYQDVDLVNYNRGVIVSDPYSWTKDYFSTEQEKQSAVYGGVRLNPADWLKVIAGLRHSRYEIKDHSDWYDQTSGGALSSWGGDEKDEYLIKYAGALVDLDKHHTVYASYTDIFQIQNQVDKRNKRLDPIEGVNYEIGAKAAYFDGNLNVAAAVFRVDQKNRAMADGECPFRPTSTCYRAAGLVQSQGYELEISGAITPNWSIGGGYTYVEKKVKKDTNLANIGVRQDTHLPTRQFKLGSSYRFLGGKARVGGSLRWQNAVWHYNNWAGHDYNTRQSAHAVLDLMVGYQLNQHTDLQLNVSNLLDQRYYSSINAQPMEWGGNTVYGEPRKFLLTARYRF